MCGIIFSINKTKNVNKDIIEQYQEQIQRGKEGFGCVFINKNKKAFIERAVEPSKFMCDLYYNKSKMILAHHRIPTSTSNNIVSTHTIVVSNKKLKFDYYVVHNVVIRNCDDIKLKQEKFEFVYTTQVNKKYNDSETIAIDTALLIEGQIHKIRALGSMAVIALQIDKKTKELTKIYTFRNELNPLNIKVEKNNIKISSMGEGEEVEAHKLFEIDAKTLNITKTKIKFKTEEVKPYANYTPYKNYYDNTKCKNSTKSFWEKDDYKKPKQLEIARVSKDYTDDIEEDTDDYFMFTKQEEIDEIIAEYTEMLEYDETYKPTDALRSIKIILEEIQEHKIINKLNTYDTAPSNFEIGFQNR